MSIFDNSKPEEPRPTWPPTKQSNFSRTKNDKRIPHWFAREATRRFRVDSNVAGVALALLVCSQRKSPVSRWFLVPFSDLSDEMTSSSRPRGSTIPTLPPWCRGSRIAPVRAERKNGTENRESSCSLFWKLKWAKTLKKEGSSVQRDVEWIQRCHWIIGKDFRLS